MMIILMNFDIVWLCCIDMYRPPQITKTLGSSLLFHVRKEENIHDVQVAAINSNLICPHHHLEVCRQCAIAWTIQSQSDWRQANILDIAGGLVTLEMRWDECSIVQLWNGWHDLRHLKPACEKHHKNIITHHDARWITCCPFYKIKQNMVHHIPTFSCDYHALCCSCSFLMLSQIFPNHAKSVLVV